MLCFTLRHPLVVYCCFFSISLFGQIPTFQKAYLGGQSDDGMWGQETPDGFLLAGRARPLTGGVDGLLIRTDRQGETLWYRNFGSSEYEYFRYAAASHDGGFFGYGVTGDLPSQMIDAWLVKVDSAGQMLWQKTIGEAAFAEGPSAAVVPVPGGCVISGTKSEKTAGLQGSFVMRLDNQGNALWSRYLTSSDNNAPGLCVQYATDTLLYAFSIRGKSVGFVTLNPANGDIVKVIEYKHPYYGLDCFGLSPTPDGNFALMGYGNPPVNEPRPIWLSKIRPDGQIIWSKAYNSSYAWASSPGITKFNTLSDGGFIVCPSESVPPLPIEWRMLMKIDRNGEVLWKKSYSYANGVPEFLWQCFETSDSGIAAVGTTRYSLQAGSNDVILMKTDANGEIDGCCSKKRNFLKAVDFQLETTSATYSQADYLSTVPFTLSPPNTVSFTATNICTGYLQTTRYDTLHLCPGETVTLGDSTYSQPGTATVAIPSITGGCDTLHITTLEPEPADPNAVLQLTCPTNISMLSTAPAVVHYDAPEASSDCLCPDVSLTQIAGSASGATFPTGLSTLCFRAEDACGKVKTCCFTVTLTAPPGDEDVCDVKTNGCLRFELLRIDRDANQNLVCRVRMTNTCADALRYAYVQIPDGLKAPEPAASSPYTSPGGNAYTVQNPNYSPFRSIRFKPASGAPANGQSDVFRYVLPTAATVPDYIHVAARLTSGAYTEAHLNTFFCPVGKEPSAKPAGAGNRSRPGRSGEEVGVYPNPLSSEEILRVRGAEGADFTLQDATGRILLETRVMDGRVLPGTGSLARGIYFFRIQKDGRALGSGKLAVVK